MMRRNFIKSTSLTALGVTVLGLTDSYGEGFYLGNNLKVNEQCIASRILELAKFGRDENGHGYRVAYTKGDVEGREWFIQLMKGTGLEVTIDSAGNIVGKRKGKNATLKPIAFVNSFGEWLIPPTLGTKIIPTGAINAMFCESCPAPLCMYL